MLRRFQGRRGWPEMKRSTRRTHLWGFGHKTRSERGERRRKGSGRVRPTPVRNRGRGEGV
jgi:hypothetical protein